MIGLTHIIKAKVSFLVNITPNLYDEFRRVFSDQIEIILLTQEQ